MQRVAFIKTDLWPSTTDVWPSTSPELNPVDYAVWGALQQLVYKLRSFTSIAELMQAIVSVWEQLSEAFIDKIINEWHCRLECVVQPKEGHIEHLFK